MAIVLVSLQVIVRAVGELHFTNAITALVTNDLLQAFVFYKNR